MPDLTITYDSATVTYDDISVSYDAYADVKVSKKKTRIEDYLGVGNALIHR